MTTKTKTQGKHVTITEEEQKFLFSILDFASQEATDVVTKIKSLKKKISNGIKVVEVEIEEEEETSDTVTFTKGEVPIDRLVTTLRERVEALNLVDYDGVYGRVAKFRVGLLQELLPSRGGKDGMHLMGAICYIFVMTGNKAMSAKEVNDLLANWFGLQISNKVVLALLGNLHVHRFKEIGRLTKYCLAKEC
jgi:hypothetical protein